MKKVLIYSYKSSGSYLPVYYECKVYRTGEVTIENGYWLTKTIDFRDSINISPESVKKIEKIIDDNSRIFSIKEVEGANEPTRTDGVSEIMHFSDGQRQNTLEVEDFSDKISNKYPGIETPDMDLLAKVYSEIREVLIASGVKEDYC